MRRFAMLAIAGIAVALLPAGCADAPTANQKNSPPTQTEDAQGSALSTAVRSVSVGLAPAVIHGCVNNSSGTIKIVSGDDGCANNEQLLTWNMEGPAGPSGPAGPKGPAGPSGISGYEIVSHQVFLPPGTANVHVECPTGKKVLGGGFSIETPTDVRLFSSAPSDGSGNLIDHGWNLFVENIGSVTRQTTVNAICVSAQ